MTFEDEGEADPNKVPPDYLQMRVTVRPQGSIRLYGRRELPLVEIIIIASTTVEKREDNSMALSFRLSRLDVRDLFTQGGVFPYLLKVGDGHDVGGGVDEDVYPGLSKTRAKIATAVAAGVVGSIKKRATGEEDVKICVHVSMSKTSLDVAVCALPTDVAYNREAMDAVLSVFSARPTEVEVARSNATKGIEAAQRKTKELVKLSVSASLDIAAPRIVVPMSSTRDDGFLLLDMGHVLVEGGSAEGGARAYRAELSDFNVRLPARKAGLLVRGGTDALIEPFKIKVDVAMCGGASEPEMLLAVEVMPGVKGIFSPEKIRSLHRVKDYVTKADLRAEGGAGEPPLGLAAPNTALGGGGVGVERIQEVGLVALDESSEEGGQEEEEIALDSPQIEPLVAMELHVKVHAVALLLIEADMDATRSDTGLYVEAAGMSIDFTDSREDVAVQVHLDALTLLDRTRPEGSSFRSVLYSTPDETTQGGLIHVAWWASAGGVQRVPPSSIAGTDPNEWDMVVDVRFSTLQLTLDTESLVKLAPLLEAATKLDRSQVDQQAAATGYGGGRRSSVSKSRTDDARSVLSSRLSSVPKSWLGDARSSVSSAAGTGVVGVARRIVAADSERPMSILIRASLTSMVLELVRSDPLEAIARAGVSGLGMRFALQEGGRSGISAAVSLDDVLLTDVRPRAKGHAYTMILAPLRPRMTPEDTPYSGDEASGGSGRSGATSSTNQAGGRPHSRAVDEGEEGRHRVERRPAIAVNARKDGDSGDLDAEVNLGSFACNLMSAPIEESVLLAKDIGGVLVNMMANDTEKHTGEGEAPEGGGIKRMRDVVDEEGKCGSQVMSRQELKGRGASGFDASAEVAGHRRDRGESAPREDGFTVGSSASSICARLTLDDWRINLIEEPSKASSKVVVLRASAEAKFTSSGQGGDSTEAKSIHLSLLNTEILVDNPALGGDDGGRSVDSDRRISQVLKPFSAQVQTTLLSARGSLLSAKLEIVAEAFDARVSCTDVMLMKRIVDQATSAQASMATVNDADNVEGRGTGADGGYGSDSDGGCGEGSVTSILPETYRDASDQLPESDDASSAGTVSRANPQSSAMAKVSFSATCSIARIVLVNDYEGQGVPVLSFSSRALKAEGSGSKEDCSVRFSGVVGADFFNVNVVRWEPLCEPWQPVLTAAVGIDSTGRRTAQVTLACDEVVMLNLTSDFMESFLSTYWMLFSERVPEDDSLAPLPAAPAASVGGEDEPEGAGPTAGVVHFAFAQASSSEPELSEPNQLGCAKGARPLEGFQDGGVTLKNRTGLQLVVGTTDFPHKLLHVGAHDTVRLPFNTHRDRTRAGQVDIRGKWALVGWGEEGMQSTREGLPPLQVDRTGVSVFSLSPKDSVPPGRVASAPVVVEAYQSQRYHNISRRWSKPHLLGDGPEFTYKDWRHYLHKHAQSRPLDSITLPDEKHWEWRDAWHVDLSREVGTQIDADGWEYALEFGAFNHVASSRTRRDVDQVRRRRWIRTRAPKPLPMDDPFRPLHLAWEVGVTPEGPLEATIRSTVQLTNSTGLLLEVRAVCSAWPKVAQDGPGGLGKCSLGCVAPGCTLDVPVKMVYASHLQLRPMADSASSSAAFASIAEGRGEAAQGLPEKMFEWSDKLPMLANNVDTYRDDRVSCREVARGDSSQGVGVQASTTIRLVVHAESTAEGCVVMTVLPPVTVVNALPCSLSFRAFLQVASPASSGSSSSGTTVKPSAPMTLETGTVSTAETAFLHTVEVGGGAKFSIKIAHHGWSAAESLLPTTPEELRAGLWAERVVTFKLPCTQGDGRAGPDAGGVGGEGHLEMTCNFESRFGASCPALRLQVFCTHWLVDRTGLRLGFGISDKCRLPVPVMPREVVFAQEQEESEAEEEQSLPLGDASPVEQLSCASATGAVVSIAMAGGLLYTDSDYVFQDDSLPRTFRGATMIRTACSDKGNGGETFLRFRVVEASTVHVLFDRRCTSPPFWLTLGFRLTATRVTSKGANAECSFVVWSRKTPAGSWVNLGGNKAQGADAMYLVVVTEEDVALPAKVEASLGASSTSSGVIKRKISSREDLMNSWTLGTEGLSLCNSPQERVRVAVPGGAGRGDAWSEELHIPSGENGVFQVKGSHGEVYELALRAEACPGTFRRTTQVTVTPRYCVVNLLDGENVWLKEPGAPEASTVCVPPGGRLPWHWMLGGNKRAGVRVRTEGTAWSYGDVVIDRVGTTALHIPFVGQDEGLDGQHKDHAGGERSGGPTQLDKIERDQTVVHVDVQLAERPFVDEYAVRVVLWKANERFAPIYSASNVSPVTVHLHQASADPIERRVLSAKAMWKLQPGERCQIGWAYPAAQRLLLISAGKGTSAVQLSADTVGNCVKVPTDLESAGAVAAAERGATDPSFVWASVVVKGASKVIHISSRPPESAARKGSGSGRDGKQQQQLQKLEKEAETKRQAESKEERALEVAVNMRGFGMSLIGPVDGRRQELLFTQVSNIRVKFSRDRLSSVEASIGSLQVDNHLSDGVYPVLLGKREETEYFSGRGDPQALETPFLQMTIIKEVDNAKKSSHFNYVAFRMLEVDVMADRTTLLQLLVWCKPVQGYLLMRRQQLDSRAWVAKRTAEVLERSSHDVPGGFVDVEEVRRTARAQREYFKTMQFHPIILRLSFARTPVTNELIEEAGLATLNIPSMVKSHVALASYLVEDTFGSVGDIAKNVITHYHGAARKQMLSLVGSMRAVGSPADLISNVGGGAKALVYAPAQGLVHGPAEFVTGVGLGAQSFVKGTVHGVFNSVAGVGGAVTDTVSKLTFDDEYQMKRKSSKRKAMADQGGVGKGLMQGGKDLAGGITAGVSGIVTAPVSGAKKSGLRGFVKGVGKGLAGAVVKPTLGVSDSVIAVAQSISNQAGSKRQDHLRPPRALTKDSETGQLVLMNFSMEAAEAQELVESGVDGKSPGGSREKYESHIQIDNLTIVFASSTVILVRQTKNVRSGSSRIFERSSSAKTLQVVSKTWWKEVASVDIALENVVIRRYEGENIPLKAAVASSREELYRQFYAHRNKMGNPTSMRRPEEVFGSNASLVAPLTKSMKQHVWDSLEGYVFGSANDHQLPKHKMSGSQMLDRAETQLQSVGIGRWQELDNMAWELVHNWDCTHNGLKATRCLCVVFINASTSTVQFLQMRKMDGHGYRVLLNSRCNDDARQLMPGGVAILFAWGHPSTKIFKDGHPVMGAETTAFSGVFAVQREKVTMTAKSSFQAGFLEKTFHEWWSKQIVVIK